MRREKRFTITAEGRDKGKVFFLREMAAVPAEKWAARAILALLKSGVELPEGASSSGIAGLAAIGLKAFSRISWEDAEPLLDEMMGCVQVIPQTGVPRHLFEEDIEEVLTLLTLRKELLELHLGFSIAAKLSSSQTSAADPGTGSSST